MNIVEQVHCNVQGDDCIYGNRIPKGVSVHNTVKLSLECEEDNTADSSQYGRVITVRQRLHNTAGSSQYDSVFKILQNCRSMAELWVSGELVQKVELAKHANNSMNTHSRCHAMFRRKKKCLDNPCIVEYCTVEEKFHPKTSSHSIYD